MNTAVLSDGVSYYIPNSDLAFFKELAARMKWKIVGGLHTLSSSNRSKEQDLEKAMALMDTMMVKGGTPVPADEDGKGAIARVKYGV